MTDNDIVKALECCKSNCGCGGCFLKKEEYCVNVLKNLALDLINRQKAEIERLKTECGLAQFEKYKAEFEEFRAEIKAEAYRECIEKVHTEISEALNSNYKAKAERMTKPKIDMADEFISYCEGKIAALRGIDDFADNILKELVGEDNSEQVDK